MAPTESVTSCGFLITVQSRHNERGCWIAHVEIRRDARIFATYDADTVQPEWLTEIEANRDGLERAFKFINRIRDDRQDHSWVALRQQAEHWFFKLESAKEAERTVRDLVAHGCDYR